MCEWSTECHQEAVGQAYDPDANVWFRVCEEHFAEALDTGLYTAANEDIDS